MNKTTLYHAASRGGFKQWSIWIEKNKRTVTVEWGLVGKSLQTSSDTAVPKGKPGTKSYKNEEVCAQENYAKQLRKKTEEGYRPTMDAIPAEDMQDWLVALDKNFVPAKPISSLPLEELESLDKHGKLSIQRKRDGRRHLVLIGRKGEVKIYSRRMEDLTEHLKGIAATIRCWALPKGTILDGEVIIDDDGDDNFKSVGRFTNPASDPKDAQATAEQYNVRYMVFDVLYYQGNPCWALPYSERHELLTQMLTDPNSRVFVSENLDLTFAQAQTLARKEGWEGLVLWYNDMGTFVRHGGKPKRTGCVKWKPVKEQDFIATGYFLGSGELSKVVGGFYLAEYCPDESGKMRPCGKVGTGLDGAMRSEALTWEYPCVLSIKFVKQENTCKLREPVVLKKHEDKTPDECVGVELDEEDE